MTPDHLVDMEVVIVPFSNQLATVRRFLRPAPEADDASTAAQNEAELSRFFDDYVARGRPGRRYLLRHPYVGFTVFRSVLRLPCLTAVLGDCAEAAAIRGPLSKLHHVPAAVLVVPEHGPDYSVGPQKQTLRRKVRASERMGTTWRLVDDPEERRRLVDRADACERSHLQDEYRQDRPDNDDLMDYGLWMVACSTDGEPLMLSVTPVYGEWASLRYFRVFGAGDEQSNARYLMTQVLVEQLAMRGVRYLADTSHPVGLTNGLRHFQRMLGFRLYRVRLRRDPFAGLIPVEPRRQQVLAERRA